MESLIISKTGQCDNYCIYLASQYFEQIDDYINLAFGCKRFRCNLDRYFYNPIPLTKQTRSFFPFLRTQFIYNENDEIFYDDKIKYYDVFYEISYTEATEMRKRKEMRGKQIKFRKMFYNSFELENACKEKNISQEDIEYITIPNEVSIFTSGSFFFCEKLKIIDTPEIVTEICSSCFNECTSLSSISLPSHLTILSASCFSGCSSLSSIKIPEQVQRIRELCFSNCSSLETVSIPSSVKYIESYSFSECISLKEIELPECLERLSRESFEKCMSLTTISLSTNIKVIESQCFVGCESLTDIQFRTNFETSQLTEEEQETIKKNCEKIKQWIFMYGVKDCKDVGCRRISINIKEQEPFETIETDETIFDFNGNEKMKLKFN